VIRQQHGGGRDLEQQHLVFCGVILTSARVVILRANWVATDGDGWGRTEWRRGCRAHSPGPCRETSSELYSEPQPFRRIPGRQYKYRPREHLSHETYTECKVAIEGDARRGISSGDGRRPSFRRARDEMAERAR